MCNGIPLSILSPQHADNPGHQSCRASQSDVPGANKNEAALDQWSHLLWSIRGKSGGRMKHVTGSMAGHGFLRELLEQIEDLAEKYLGGSAVPNSLKWREPIIGIVRRCCYTNH
jgi:hypothetical protein